MQVQRPRVALVVTACVCALYLVRGEYEALKECPREESCVYTYSANQTSSMSGTEAVLHVSSAAEVSCDSVGNYGAKEATKYCIRLTGTSIGFNKGKRLSEASSDAERLLSGPFCFVQTEDGKVVSVYHNPEESAQIVNFKKGIAAAFQANFKNTQVEVEEDTQSKHYSRYRYTKIASDHVIMHRTVDAESVIQFASKTLDGKPIKMERAEDVEYKEGKLLSSQGTTVMELNGPIDSSDINRFESSSDEAEVKSSVHTFDPTFAQGGLRGGGMYSLRLKNCAKDNKVVRRSTGEQRSLAAHSNLHAVVQRDAEVVAKEEMVKLREVLPSIPKALDALRPNMSDDVSIRNALKNLLILESRTGPLPGYRPAISEVVDYLNSESDMEMRALLYSFLAADGSVDSQKILFRAVKKAKERKERNTLVTQLAFLRNFSSEIAAEVEKLILSTNDTTDPLVLSYGALAASSPDLQRRIVKFLEERIQKEKGNVPALIHLIHSLGNTESSLADQTLLQFTDHEDFDVRMAAVYALRYSVDLKDIQDALFDAIRKDQGSGLAEMVTRALIAGTESKQQYGATPIGDALFEAIVQQANNNTELRAMVYYYVNMLGPKAPKEWIGVLQKKFQKRGTTNWSDTSDSLYNLVEDARARRSDVSNYPSNKAYIWSKSFGVPAIKMDVAFGAFAGFGGRTNPTSYKLFARGVARGYAFGHTATAFEALLFSEKQHGAKAVSSRLYVSLVGKVLLNDHAKKANCKGWSHSLYNTPEFTLLSFTYSVFIYAGTLDFSISLSVKLGVTGSLSACIGRCITAKGALSPSVTLIPSAGASATLAELVRGGIEISGKFEYQIQPQLTAGYRLPKGPFDSCLKLKHGWPNNGVSIYPYYQFRKIEMCKAWLASYPCGFSWGEKNKWKTFSKDWSLSSSGMGTLWTNCNSRNLKCMT